MENNTKLSEVMMEMKSQIDYLKKENQKYLDLLTGFGYPEKRPQPQAKVQYWKDKYKRLIYQDLVDYYTSRLSKEDVIQLLSEYDEYSISFSDSSVEKVVNEAGIQVNLRDYEGITSQAGVPLVPGTGPTANINYKPFGNVF